jgi:hypothetical protein
MARIWLRGKRSKEKEMETDLVRVELTSQEHKTAARTKWWEERSKKEKRVECND